MKTVNIFWMVLAPFKHFTVNFTKYYPFKGARADYVCVFWLESSSSHWVDAESDSPSTESTRVRLHVNWVNAEDNNYEDFIIPRWLSWRGVSLRVDSVDMESHLALTQLTRNEIPCQLNHRRMLQNLNNLTNSRTISKNSKALLFGLCVFAKCKKREQKNLIQVYL